MEIPQNDENTLCRQCNKRRSHKKDEKINHTIKKTKTSVPETYYEWGEIPFTSREMK